MPTPEEVIDDVKTRWALGRGVYNGASIITALNAAGYVIESKQSVWNTERMRAALIGIAAMKRTDPAVDAKWAAEEAAAAIKWCVENSSQKQETPSPEAEGL